MNRTIDGVIGGTRPTAPGPLGRVPSPIVEPESRSFETRPFSRGSKVGSPRVNALPNGPGAVGRTHIQNQVQKKYFPKAPKKPWKERLQLPLIIIGGILAGLAIQSPHLGQALIVLYGIAAITYKIPSRITFLAALAALLSMLGLLFFNGDPGYGHTFAIYTFMLLVVGVITLNREIKREGGRIYSRRYR